MASVEEDGRIVGAALLAPPFNLLISPASVTALDALAEQLHGWRVTLPGVIGLATASDAFAAGWQRHHGCRAERGKEMRLLALGAAPRPPAAPGALPRAIASGAPRPAVAASDLFG